MNTNTVDTGFVSIGDNADQQAAENGSKTFSEILSAQSELKQLQDACAREVWSRDEIPPEVAEHIVRQRMLSELNKWKGARETYVPQIALELIQYSSSGPVFRWKAQPVLLKKSGEGETLEEALANVPKHKTAEEEKADKIADLKSKIAELESN